ncbi:hypothetical protein [Gracilimonas sp. BCB1]|uniref:hypothetical protein n=1 Tax=Gracilimonas sp. BCB1 TaxID=3152362 RepID=UPI0032DCF93D
MKRFRVFRAPLQRIVNLVLSDLLEMLWLVKVNNPKLLIDKLIKELESRLNTNLSKDEDFQKFLPIIQEVLAQKSEKFNPPKDNFDESYNEHLSELSTIYPILSYRLRGKNRLINISKTVAQLEKGYLNNLKEAGLEDINTLQITNYLSSEMKEYNFSQVTETIESNIKEVSSKCGLKTYFKTKKYLNDIDELINENIDSGFAIAFEKLESFIKESSLKDQVK